MLLLSPCFLPSAFCLHLHARLRSTDESRSGLLLTLSKRALRGEERRRKVLRDAGAAEAVDVGEFRRDGRLKEAVGEFLTATKTRRLNADIFLQCA